VFAVEGGVANAADLDFLRRLESLELTEGPLILGK